jgi:hypothetical protein
MSALTYSQEHLGKVEPDGTPKRRPFWRRAFDAMVESQQRRAEREVVRYLASHGGLLTDDMEREIMRRLSGVDRRTL